MTSEALIASPSAPRRRGVQLAAGTIVPIVLLFFDPIVFRQNPHVSLGESYLGAWRAFAYVSIALAAAFYARSLFAARMTRIEAGLLYGAALLSLALGLAMLPLSVIGIFIGGIGFLGFMPLVTAWMYFRAASRHHRAVAGRRLSRASAGGMLLFLSIGAVAQLAVNGAVRLCVANIETHPTPIRMFIPLYEPDQLFLQWVKSWENDAQRRRLAIAYERMTGESIEARLARNPD